SLTPYLSRHLATRPLHSFPTRRSSDLEPALGHGGHQRRHARHQPQRGGEVDGEGLKVAVVDPHQRRPGLEGRRQLVLVVHLDQRDRKSTRLNSSHVSISYAVFCLKKKK